MASFGWKGVGFQCEVCFNSVPTHISFTMCGELMMEMEPPKSMRKSPPELLNKEQLQQNKSLVTMKTTNLTNDTNDERNKTGGDDQTFLPTFLTSPSPYLNHTHYHWLSILLKTTTPPNPVTLNDASLCSCFALVVKIHKLSEPWRHVIVRKVPKRTWEMLDEFGETVLNTVIDTHDTKLTDLWGKWLKHPNVSDYKSALHSDLKGKATRDKKDQELKELPMRIFLGGGEANSFQLKS